MCVYIFMFVYKCVGFQLDAIIFVNARFFLNSEFKTTPGEGWAQTVDSF